MFHAAHYKTVLPAISEAKPKYRHIYAGLLSFKNIYTPAHGCWIDITRRIQACKNYKLDNLQSKILKKKPPKRFSEKYIFCLWKNTILFVFKLIQCRPTSIWLRYQRRLPHPLTTTAVSCSPSHTICSPFTSSPFFHFLTKPDVSAGHLHTPATSTHFPQHHKAAHFHSLQRSPLLPGPLKSAFAQGELAGNLTAPQHEKQIRARNTIPQIKPLSVWKNGWEVLLEYLPSSAHKDLNLFAIFPSPWVCGLWQAGR